MLKIKKKMHNNCKLSTDDIQFREVKMGRLCEIRQKVNYNHIFFVKEFVN